jgi:hypothetical protein
MPQATIKLQVPPASAAAIRKPVVSEAPGVSSDDTAAKSSPSLPKAATEAAPASVSEAEESDEDGGASALPIPLLIAAAALALIAFGIQLWTFLS